MLLFVTPNYWVSRLIMHPHCPVSLVDARVMTLRETIEAHVQLDLLDQIGRERMEQLQRDTEASNRGGR